jgi:hypothetical protein
MRRRLLLMLKFPTPGAVKTRLVPALGAARACALHRALAAGTLAEVARFAAAGDVAVEVRVAGAPDSAAARAWLGEGVTIRDQGEGDLGARMERAVGTAFAEGAAAVVVIGGDCPGLGAAQLAAAFAALERHAVVLGPAADGGYYLIGLRRPVPALFHGIAWGTAEVRAQTLAAARTESIAVGQLDTLHDLYVPDDLPRWAETPAARAAGRGGVSVVIPALNEAEQLPATLAAVQRDAPHEIVVVDGGSTDLSAGIARAHDAIALVAPRGRAVQLNAGAAVATGEYLLFLHADTLPPAGYPALVRAALADPAVAGGAFEFAIAGNFPGRRVIERGTNWRSRWRQRPYGDQGIFVRRDTFFQVGGFPPWPIMEDDGFVRRLRRLGRIAIAPAPALTSGRRWATRGALRTTLLNQCIVLGFRLGVPPDRLARWYRGNKDAARAISPSR